MECLSCKSLNGEIIISPGGVIYEGVYWRVEHAYPTALLGWLVIILKRHCQALHELKTEEFQELALIQKILVDALRTSLNSEKEYVAIFAEKEGFNHIHVHVIARPKDLPPEFKGPKIFSLLNADKEKMLLSQDVVDISSKIKQLISKKT